MKKLQAIQGMHDILPIDQRNFKINTHVLRAFENMIVSWACRFAYKEIRTPIVEQTDLFVRSVGEETDVVGKEMYTFSDSNDTLNLTLRPEGTASCLRAVVEHNLQETYNTRKLWYMGAMFRRERPQKGRYRQFHQVGVEAIGFSEPDIDAEMVVMCADLWRELGISQHLTLEINSLGNREERAQYRAALVAYLTEFEDKLDDDSKRRLYTNPLRVLDTKNPDLQEICNNAPRLIDYLGEASQKHYQTFKDLLTGLDIQFVENPRLVRGLDYYNHTVFEWTTDKLGAQATVCGGGRYDGLMEELGGKPAPSIGFAMGVERLLLLAQEYGKFSSKSDGNPSVFIIKQGDVPTLQVMKYAKMLRDKGISVAQFLGTAKMKKQFEIADKSGADIALIIGESELENDEVTLKDLRGNRGQMTVPSNELFKQLDLLRTIVLFEKAKKIKDNQ